MWNYLKRLQTADYTLLFLTLVMSILSLYCILMPRGLADDLTYRSHGFEGDWWISIRFNPSLDSLIVESLNSRLNSTTENAPVLELLKSLASTDSMSATILAKIVAINGVPWDASKIKGSNWQDILGRKLRSHRNESITFIYKGTIYKAILDYKTGNFKVTEGICSRLVILWLVLYPALSINAHHRKLFMVIFCIRMAALMVECVNAYVLEDLYLITIFQAFNNIADLVLYIPIGKILHKHNKILSYIFIAMLLFLSFGKYSNFRYLPYVLSLGYAIYKQKGINKRFFRKYLYNFLALLVVMTAGTLIHASLSYQDVSEMSVASHNKIWLITGYWNYLIMIIGYRMVVLTLYFSLMYRVLHLRVEMIERLFTWLIASVFVVLSSNVFVDLFISFKDIVHWEVPALLLSVLVAVFANNRLIRLVPLFTPVRFSVREKGMEILNNSYSFSDPASYSEYFIKELGRLYPKVQCAIYTESFISGSPFPSFTPTQYESICNQVEEKVSFVNIDAEILNNTALGNLFSEYDRPQMPHLIYFVRDSAKVVSLLALGKMSGIYWHSSVAKALNVLVDVYRGFYLGILRQQELVKSSILLDRETEAREYNEKMIKLTTEANERLTEEKMKMVKSIEYASLIQRSILPQESEIAAHFRDYFIHWKPRDIVGGDFYWMHVSEAGEILFALIDCTGHGVPGALLSMTVNSILHNLVKDMGLSQPSVILSRIHQEIGAALHQKSEHTQQDGIEMALVKINPATRILEYAGGGLNLLHYRPAERQWRVIAGERYGLGGLKWHRELVFSGQSFALSAYDTIYLCTDGIIDQNMQDEGKSKRLGSARWQEFLSGIAELPIPQQKERIELFIGQLLQAGEQRDDISVIGLQL